MSNRSNGVLRGAWHQLLDGDRMWGSVSVRPDRFGMKDIFATHSGSDGVSRWSSRFSYECEDGIVRPMSALWADDRPAALRTLIAALRLVACETLCPATRRAFLHDSDLALAGHAASLH